MAGYQKLISYSAQVLAGCSATGAIFADGSVTALRVSLAVVAALSSVTALLVTISTHREQEKHEAKMRVMLEGATLPYPLEDEVNRAVSSVSLELGHPLMRLERFKGLNCYFLGKPGHRESLIALRDQDLRNLFLSTDRDRSRQIRELIENGPPPSNVDDVVREVIFRAVGTGTVDGSDDIDPMRAKIESNGDGSTAYIFEFPQSGRSTYTLNTDVPSWSHEPFSFSGNLRKLYDRVSAQVRASSARHDGAPRV